MKQKITPCLWFEKDGEEALSYYTTIFKDAKIISSTKGPEGSFLTGFFAVGEQEFMILQGGPVSFKFSEAISFSVDCQDQEEVDYFWEKLIADGGEESQCGWLKDKYGLSWQIIPKQLGELMSDPDQEKAGRVMQAMLKMTKIEIQTLQDAYEDK